MSDIRRCGRCQTELHASSLSGLCPKCLLESGLDWEQAAREDARPPNRSVSAGRQFGQYELLEEVARGGMGVVYKARQKSLNRIVALKLLIYGRFSNAESIQRFRAEASAAARLQHPNIVAIHDIGEAEGQQYFSMDFIDGRRLSDLIAEKPLEPKRAARYIQCIAEAVHYAHQNGILHRDLKPSNVLIDQFDQPRITDFGLAKELESDSDITVTGQVLGSPNFMPPEQASGRHTEIGPWSDIYSLGAMFYHLLTHRPPFQAATAQEVLLQVSEMEPVPPRRLSPSIPRDLETICLKCLEKEPARRYRTGRELADELGRFLRDEPIHARPIGAPSRALRWMRRRPVIATLCGLLLLSVVLGFTGVLWQWRRAELHASRESAERHRAEESLVQLNLRRAEDFFELENVSAAVPYLARSLRDAPSNHIAAQRLISALSHRSFALPATRWLQHKGTLAMAVYSPDGRAVLTASSDGTAQLWDALSGEPTTPPLVHGRNVRYGEFSSDGTKVVTSADGLARVWNAKTGEPITPSIPHRTVVLGASFSPDGLKIVTAAGDPKARIWSAETGERIGSLEGHTGPINWAEFSPDGQRLVTASSDHTGRVWNSLTGESTGVLPHARALMVARFSPDGTRVATGSMDGTARVWDAETGTPVTPPLKHDDVVRYVEFSADGKRLASASNDKTARIWNAATGESISVPLKHGAEVFQVRFSPEGRRVVTASLDYTARVWTVATGRPLCEPMRHEANVYSAVFSPDGDRVLTASLDYKARIWDVRLGVMRPPRLPHGPAVRAARFSPDGRRILTASSDSTAKVWEASTGKPLGPLATHEAAVVDVEFSPDGENFVTASADNTARVWSTRTGEAISPPLVHAKSVLSARWSADGTRVVTVAEDATARVWDARTGRAQTAPLKHEGRILGACFTPDGKSILTHGWTPHVLRQTLEGSNNPAAIAHHMNTIWTVAFSADGRRLLTASADGTARIWDQRTGGPLTEPMKHDSSVRFAAFSPDGSRVVTATKVRAVQIWDAHIGKPLTAPMLHDDVVNTARFSPDGRRIVTASDDKTARVWDGKTGHPLTEPLPHYGKVVAAEFSPDGQRILTASEDGTASLWDVPEAPLPPPAWLAELAEALTGRRWEASGAFSTVAGTELIELGEGLKNAGDDFYSRWGRWFFADRETRNPSPF